MKKIEFTCICRNMSCIRITRFLRKVKRFFLGYKESYTFYLHWLEVIPCRNQFKLDFTTIGCTSAAKTEGICRAICSHLFVVQQSVFWYFGCFGEYVSALQGIEVFCIA